jgi:hypothetical protein
MRDKVSGMDTPKDARYEFTLRCSASDPYDASIRLLNDAQRYGAELVHLHFEAPEGLLSLTVRVPQAIDARNLADRLGRHRAVDLVLPQLSR